MSNLIGKRGENCAAEYMKAKQYTVVEKNYYSKYGEIDIIAENQEYIVFVEVKTRKRNCMVDGREYINKMKQSRIVRTALQYLNINETEKQVRFDVIEVEFISVYDMYVKCHIENAFSGEEWYETV